MKSSGNCSTISAASAQTLRLTPAASPSQPGILLCGDAPRDGGTTKAAPLLPELQGNKGGPHPWGSTGGVRPPQLSAHPVGDAEVLLATTKGVIRGKLRKLGGNLGNCGTLQKWRRRLENWGNCGGKRANCGTLRKLWYFRFLSVIRGNPFQSKHQPFAAAAGLANKRDRDL